MDFILEYFLLGLLIGILIYYIYFNEMKIIFKNPIPNEANPTIYIDDNGVCYKYKTIQIECDTSK